MFLKTKLRIGLAEQTLLTALGYAIVYTENGESPSKHSDSPLEEVSLYSVITEESFFND